MQRAFGTARFVGGIEDPEVKPEDPSASLGATLLRRRQRLIQPRLATIRSIFVNDSALGSFINCGDYRTNLIPGSFRGTNSLLHSTQTRYDTPIAKRTF